MYRKHYPPARYIFYPLYRHLRKRVRLPSTVAYFTVFAASAVLHAVLMLLFRFPVAALLFFILYVVLGLIGVVAIIRKRGRRLRATRPSSHKMAQQQMIEREQTVPPPLRSYRK